MTSTRRCYTCRTVKPLDAFYTNVTGGRTYYRGNCKACETDLRLQRSRKRSAARKSTESLHAEAARARSRRAALCQAERVILDARAADRKRGHETDLTVDRVETLFASGCVYCGEQSAPIGLDRIDNNRGHTIDNVNPACARCNYVRRDMPYDAWLLLVPAMRVAVKTGMFGDWAAGGWRLAQR